MKRLAKMYYGRTAAYADAIERRDDAALEAALCRNIRPDQEEWAESPQLAAYVKAAVENLASQPVEAICAGKVHYPQADDQGK
jgi:cytochrome b pre-mRNA-processing protein 3